MPVRALPLAALPGGCAARQVDEVHRGRGRETPLAGADAARHRVGDDERGVEAGGARDGARTGSLHRRRAGGVPAVHLGDREADRGDCQRGHGTGGGGGGGAGARGRGGDDHAVAGTALRVRRAEAGGHCLQCREPDTNGVQVSLERRRGGAGRLRVGVRGGVPAGRTGVALVALVALVAFGAGGAGRTGVALRPLEAGRAGQAVDAVDARGAGVALVAFVALRAGRTRVALGAGRADGAGLAGDAVLAGGGGRAALLHGAGGGEQEGGEQEGGGAGHGFSSCPVIRPDRLAFRLFSLPRVGVSQPEEVSSGQRFPTLGQCSYTEFNSCIVTLSRTVILNEVKDPLPISLRDSSFHSE